MRFDRLELENWMGIPRLELDFSPGINLVYGKNEIGKSSVIESIRQALLGDASIKKAEYKSLMPWGSAVKAQVGLSFHSRGENYRITKSFPAGNTALYQRGISVADDSRTVREKLFHILGISEKTKNLLHLLYINQGESLAIFDRKGKDNLLDDNTKSHIKEVIKETAFRELQEFQNHIANQLDLDLQGERKNLKKGSEYYRLREKEIEVAAELNALKTREETLSMTVTQIEQADQAIRDLQNERDRNAQYLDELKQKKKQADDLEKKNLSFIPIKNDYDDYIKMADEREIIRRRLPALLVTRKRRINDLKKRIADLENEKTQTEEYLKQLKFKKQEGERIDPLTRAFEKTNAEYQELRQMEIQVHDLQTDIPKLLFDSLDVQENELKKISEKRGLRTQTEHELEVWESKLKTLPKITPKEIKDLRKIETEINRLSDKILSSREKLKLDFRLTPEDETEISYCLQTDDNPPQTGTTAEPLERSGFQKLRLDYPGHLAIHVTGNLAETDFHALQNDLSSRKVIFETKLATANLATVDEWEKKHAEIEEIKRTCDNLRIKLEALEKPSDLENQQQTITEIIESLKQDISKYVGTRSLPVDTGTETETNRLPWSMLSQRLSEAKAQWNAFQHRRDQILTGRQQTFEEFETEYRNQENELNMQRDTFQRLEPLSLPNVTDQHVEQAFSKIHTIVCAMDASCKEKALLEDMESLSPEMEIGDFNGSASDEWLNSQQLRDEVMQTLNRRRELERRQREILREMSEEAFKMNYSRRKAELEQLKDQIKKIPPFRLEESRDIDEQIDKTEKSIQRISDEKSGKEKLRERWIGETEDFSRLIEERADKKLEYEKILMEMKRHVSDMASLKLLDRLIEEEKANAQQEVFKPLQEKVVGRFGMLVGDRYRIGIDNDLNLEIAGKTLTGGYQSGVEQALSFGTKEQLSFLLRLAIAMELSRQEPGVMILDDSFVNTDAHRFPRLMDMVWEQASTLQFLIFTCRPSDYLDYFSVLGNANVQRIDLEKKLAG